MNATATSPRIVEQEFGPARRDISVDYLRTTLTLMVLAHHSSLAYTTFARFDNENPFRSTAPVVDARRWIFFDYAENFNDVFFMSLMFFVSGLFVYSAIRRRGTIGFIRDRLLRLGVPFAFAVVFLMPVAYYASWQLSGKSTGFVDFWVLLARHGFAAGPPWFIWMLLFFDVAVALLLVPCQRVIPVVARLVQSVRNHPAEVMGVSFVVTAALYIPLLFRYGFGTWTDFITPPLSFQICRFGLYAFWFVFGVLVGAPGYAQGLLSRDGPLARRWPYWVLFCFIAYNALSFVPRWWLVHQLAGATQRTLEAFLWVGSCVASCFAFLALFRGVGLRSRRWMDSLSRSAYVMYLVHYVFITWSQRLVMDLRVHAVFKFSLVFGSTTLMSWMTAQLLLRIPKLKSIL